MAQKLLKRKPRKVVPTETGNGDQGTGNGRAVAPRLPCVSAVLVGTYKAKQLAWIKRHGIYNYPVKDGDEFNEKSFAAIKELWLYADVKGTRHVFEAEFVGVKTRDELVNEYGYPANGVFGRVERVDGRGKRLACPKSHGSRYYVFKTTSLDYGSRLDDPFVIARTADFGRRSAKVKKAIAQFKADGEFAPLEHYLPSDLSKVPRNRLRVCEAAVQCHFLQWTPVGGMSPLLGKIESIVMSIGEFGRAYSLSPSDAYAYLKKYKGLAYLDDYHEPLSCLPMESLVDDLAKVCRNNGGMLK